MVEALEKAKNIIRQELDAILKTAVQQYHEEDKLFDDTVQAICNVIEAVFIHGLKDAFFLKGSRFSKYPEPNFWPFVSKFTHRSIKNQIGDLKQIKSEIGKARAWIRIVLNEGQLEHYINLLSKDAKQLNNFYLKNAFLHDAERLEALMGYLGALTKLPLNAPINSSFLNTWTPSPLILSGLISGKHQRVTHLASSKRRNASSNSLGQDDAAEEALSALELLDESSTSESPLSPFRKNLVEDDDASSVYSHGSMIDTGLAAPTNLKPTYSPFLSSTPENRTLDEMTKIKFRLPEEESPTEVLVNRRKTTRVRRLSKGSGSDENSSRRGSLTHINPPEIIPMSSSLPTGCGLLSLNEMKAMLKKNQSSAEITNTNSPPHLSDTEDADGGPVFSIQGSEDHPSDNVSHAQTEPITIFGSFDDADLSERSNNKPMVFGTSLHDELMAATRHQDESSSSVFPGTSPSSGPSSSIGNSLANKGWSIASRKDSLASTISSPGYDTIHCTFDNALKSVLKDDYYGSSESISSPTLYEDSQTLLNRQLSEIPENVLQKADEIVESKLVLIKEDKNEPVIIEAESLMDTDEYGISRNLLLTFTEVPIERGLADQDYRCPSCRKSIGGPFGKFFLCSLDARYYCNDCWKKGDESIIPARVVLNWDCKRRPISKASKAFLRANADRPLIRVDQINPQIYTHSKQLAKILKLREKLSLVVVYLLSCKQSVAEDLKQRIWPQDYFYNNIHLYSVTDLQNAITGVLERRLNNIIKFAITHIESCNLCLQKGFICEICSAKKIIYPFQTDIADRCNECGAVYHIKCFKNVDCPKCIRRSKYNANRSAELPLE
uniref:RUN domain-containing protein n=1 Tax=Panagrolaimus superbus TaxID=310955 RepID=A0A914ZF33_9BILA